MSPSSATIAFIGFGEAGQAFAEDMAADRKAAARAFDLKTTDNATRAAKRADYARCGIAGAETLADALAGADLVISVVTADQALAAARAAAPLMGRGALYCDFNSVAPRTKTEAAAAVEASGGRYADVAVMSPVLPAKLATPLLVGGEHAVEACGALRAAGFEPRAVDGPVGRASTVKMVRSVLVKGLEALSAECFLAAEHAGVTAEVRDSLRAAWPGVDWEARADYNLERMMVHGLRRAAELDEVALTLGDLGVDAAMTRAAAEKQRTVGQLGLSVPEGLSAKSRALGAWRRAA